jgi:hypothetical protein
MNITDSYFHTFIVYRNILLYCIVPETPLIPAVIAPSYWTIELRVLQGTLRASMRYHTVLEGHPWFLSSLYRVFLWSKLNMMDVVPGACNLGNKAVQYRQKQVVYRHQKGMSITNSAQVEVFFNFEI